MSESHLAGYPVVIEQAVAWGEMDAYRHVNNIIYFRYFENARLEYFRRLDWFQYEKETGVSPILASTSARYRKPLTYPDTIQIGVRVSAIGDDRFTMDYRIVSRNLAAVATEGHGVVVTYDHGRHQKVPIPDELRRRIAELDPASRGLTPPV